MTRRHVHLSELVSWLDDFLVIGQYNQNPAFSRYVPMAYDAIGLSHAGSEFLVMKELAPFFTEQLGLTAAVPEAIWWR